MRIFNFITLAILLLISILFGDMAMAKEKLPFVGVRRFNLYGGSGTGQSITIDRNGKTTIKVHGTVSTEIIYKGKFSNPITINSYGQIYKYLFKKNKIYELDKNGKTKENCKREGTICESDLSS
jgi:hypothetical protein